MLKIKNKKIFHSLKIVTFPRGTERVKEKEVGLTSQDYNIKVNILKETVNGTLLRIHFTQFLMSCSCGGTAVGMVHALTLNVT